MNNYLPPSIFGARCDVFMDIVVVSMAIILSLLWYSLKKVRQEKRIYSTKKFNWPCLLFCLLSWSYLIMIWNKMEESLKWSKVQPMKERFSSISRSIFTHFYRLPLRWFGLFWSFFPWLNLINHPNQILLVKHTSLSEKLELGTWHWLVLPV